MHILSTEHDYISQLICSTINLYLINEISAQIKLEE